MAAAIEKANREAFLLLESLERGDNGICNSQRTKRRLMSLRSELVQTRYDHFKQKTVERTIPSSDASQVYSLEELMHKFDVKYVPLYSGEFHVVRVLSDAFVTLGQMRDVHRGQALELLDPYC